MGNLRDVDAVLAARTALIADHGMVQRFGQDGVGDRIGPDNRPPYPRLRLLDPPGNDQDLTHLLSPLLVVEALGDLDGSTSKPALRDLLYDALQVLRAIPTRPVGWGVPVITRVQSTGGGGWSPLPSGQPRYIATLQITGHPPRALPQTTGQP